MQLPWAVNAATPPGTCTLEALPAYRESRPGGHETPGRTSERLDVAGLAAPHSDVPGGESGQREEDHDGHPARGLHLVPDTGEREPGNGLRRWRRAWVRSRAWAT